jgi:hypothetical protein
MDEKIQCNLSQLKKLRSHIEVENYTLPNGRVGKIVWKSEDGKAIGVQVRQQKKDMVFLVRVEPRAAVDAGGKPAS